jgi:hypothetical protein
MPGKGELEPDPEAVERRMPGAQEAHLGQVHPQAPQVMVVLDRL